LDGGHTGALGGPARRGRLPGSRFDCLAGRGDNLSSVVINPSKGQFHRLNERPYLSAVDKGRRPSLTSQAPGPMLENRIWILIWPAGWGRGPRSRSDGGVRADSTHYYEGDAILHPSLMLAFRIPVFSSHIREEAVPSLAARRLVIAYGPPVSQGAPFVELVDRIPIQKVTWSIDVDLSAVLGTFLDLRDADDRPRFRTEVPGMFARIMHAHGADPDSPYPAREVTELEPDVFTVVVPDRNDVQDVVLLGSPDAVSGPVVEASGIDPAGGVQELARLPWNPPYV
jgi:hypothetical protein